MYNYFFKKDTLNTKRQVKSMRGGAWASLLDAHQYEQSLASTVTVTSNDSSCKQYACSRAKWSANGKVAQHESRTNTIPHSKGDNSPAQAC